MSAVVSFSAAGASAQPFEIDWFTIDGGGGTSVGGGFELSGTIGQPDAGPTLSGGGFELTGGFWVITQTPSGGSRLCADINGDGVITGVDFTDFITAFGTNNSLADQNQDGSITGVDFTDFITNFGLGPAGPTCP